MADYTPNAQTYFAAEIGDALKKGLAKKISDAANFVQTSQIFNMLRKSYRAYYNLAGDSRTSYLSFHDEVFAGGDEGELSLMSANHYRNLAQHVLTLTTSQRPAWTAMASNTDWKSMGQCILAQGLLDYCLRAKRLERLFTKATELAIHQGAGYITATWDQNEGPLYGVDPETGQPKNQGDIVFRVFSPWDVFFDSRKTSWEEVDWVILQRQINKHELVARFPEMEAEIFRNSGDPSSQISDFHSKLTSTDEMMVYEFYHKKTKALPSGRHIVCLRDGTVLLDVALPYKDLPIYRIAAGDLSGTPFAYSMMFDLLGLQQQANALISTVISNQNAFGTHRIILPAGCNITPQELSEGVSVLKMQGPPGAEPHVLELLKTPNEIFKMIEMTLGQMETISGVNATVRGNPPPNSSGSAMALLQSQALQFASGLQASYAALVEDVGTAVVNIYKQYAKTPVTLTLMGKGAMPYEKTFTNDDLAQVDRVTVDSGNALSKTTAGRLQMFDSLRQVLDANGKPVLTRLDQVVQILTTGRLEPAYENEQAQLMLIRAENEQLMEGQIPAVLLTDPHAKHIQEHAVVGANPEIRNNPQVMQALAVHQMAHMEQLRTADPGLLQVLGQTPIMPAPPPMPPNLPPGDPNAPPSGAPMPPGPPVDPNAMPVPPPPPAGGPQPTLPGMPRMPVNPATKKPWNPQTGGA